MCPLYCLPAQTVVPYSALSSADLTKEYERLVAAAAGGGGKPGVGGGPGPGDASAHMRVALNRYVCARF